MPLILEQGRGDQRINATAQCNCNCFSHLEKGLVRRFDLHGSCGACRYTELANAAFLLLETHRHVRPFYTKGTGRADCRACTAMGTDLLVAIDFLGGVLYINALGSQVIDAFFEIFLGAGQFHDHIPLFARQNSGVEDIEDQIEVTRQVTNDGFFNFGSGKS